MLQKLKTEKTVSYILLVLFLISLLPMLYISRYNHSCADDYSYGLLARQAWLETHSIWSAFKAAVENVGITYVEWQGTYSSILLMSLQPSVFGERLYVITPFLMLGTFIAGMAYFLKVTLVQYLHASRYQFLAILSILLFLSIQLVYSPVQAFYWFNGSIHYVFMHGIMLLQFGVVLHQMKVSGKLIKSLYVVMASIMGIVIGGGNYITVLMTLILLFVILFASIITDRKQVLYVFIPFAITFLAFMISAIAPGNAIRKSVLGITYSPSDAILYSFRYALQYLDSFINLPLLMGVLLAIPFLWNIAKHADYHFKMPGLFIGFSFCLFASTFTPTVYATGGAGLGRNINIMFFFFILLLFADILYLLGWYAKYIAKSQVHTEFTKSSLLYMGIALLFMILSCKWLAANTFTFVSAYYSIITEEAKIYDAEVGERYVLYGDPSIQDVEVEPFSKTPYVLYLDDITTEANELTNYQAAEFFEKNSIKLISK